MGVTIQNSEDFHHLMECAPYPPKVTCASPLSVTQLLLSSNNHETPIFQGSVQFTSFWKAVSDRASLELFSYKYLWSLLWDIVNLDFECWGSLRFYDFLGVSRIAFCIGYIFSNFWGKIFLDILYNILYIMKIFGLAGGNRHFLRLVWTWSTVL